MLHDIANLLLCLSALASAVMCVTSDFAGRPRGVYVFKPLTMVLVLLVAVQVAPSTERFYAAAIVAGLVFSLAGDVFLMLPSDRFIAGLSSFLIGHLCYIAAFTSGTGFQFTPDSLLVLLLAAGVVYARLRPRLGSLQLPVLVYVLVIVTMAWQAVERWRTLGDVGALLACAGALLFVVSDAALAINRFLRPLPAAQAVVLGTYFPGQLLIASSVGVGTALVDWAIR